MTAKEERQKLEKMIDETKGMLDVNVPGNGEIPELVQAPSFEIDYDKLEKTCDKQAKKLLKNATGLVIGDEMIKGNSYLKSKLQTDNISLSGMLFQMEVKKIMQKDLMEEVRHGNKAARMYEVFASLGKVISEDNKQLLQTVEAIKETYISLRGNIEERQDEIKQLNGDKSEDEKMLSMGSRGMIEEAKKIKILKRNVEIIDINEESES